MLLFLFLFGLALGAVSPSEEQEVKLERASCPMFWSSFNNRCYKYVATRITWADAEIHCVSEGANLVSIHSLDEENFVSSLIKSSDPTEGLTWIGLSDIHKEGTWMWSDGSAVDFTNWMTGQPDNSGGHENCVQNKHEIGHEWNDIPCAHVYPSVCASRITCPVNSAILQDGNGNTTVVM